MPKTNARKEVTLTVTVSVPAWMNKTQAKREVRTLVNDQSNYMDHGPNFEEVHEKTVRVKRMN